MPYLLAGGRAHQVALLRIACWPCRRLPTAHATLDPGTAREPTMTVQLVPSRAFDIDEDADDGRPVLRVAGAIDVAAAPRLRRALVGAQAPGPDGEPRRPPVVDLSATTSIDAAGLGVLLSAARLARRHGHTLELRAPNARVVRLLEVTALAPLFRIRPRLDEPARLPARWSAAASGNVA